MIIPPCGAALGRGKA
ncbi:TPA: IlvGEDA operon leader peptide [Escherichia coli]